MTKVEGPTFDEFLADVDADQRPILEAVHAIVVGLHPERFEIVWSRQRIASFGVGPKKMSQHYAYLAPQKAHVNLGFYHGPDVEDPEGLLEGTGARMRHVKLTDVAQARSAAIEELLKSAIADRKANA